MKENPLLDRIVVNPKVMVGKPVIKGTRLTVEYVINLLAHGATEAEITEEYKDLTVRIFRLACYLRPKPWRVPSSCRWRWSLPDALPCG